MYMHMHMSYDTMRYSYVLVYTESSLGEQDVPASVAVSDVAASAGKPCTASFFMQISSDKIR